MTFGELKDIFLKTLKRRDVTPAQLETWINFSIMRAQRTLRTPASEVVVEILVEPGFDKLLIPNDYLQLLKLSVNGVELTRGDSTTVRALAEHVGTPRQFIREEAYYVIGPKPSTGSKIEMIYHANFTALSADADHNWLSRVAPDLIIAGAMSQACRFFVDPRQIAFEEQFVQAMNDLDAQGKADELTNARMSFGLNFDLDD